MWRVTVTVSGTLLPSITSLTHLTLLLLIQLQVLVQKPIMLPTYAVFFFISLISFPLMYVCGSEVRTPRVPLGGLRNAMAIVVIL